MVGPLISKKVTLPEVARPIRSPRRRGMSSDCGIVKTSALAVLRVMTRLNFRGCSTGISAGEATGEVLSVELFVAALEASSYTFAAAVNGNPTGAGLRAR